LWWQRPRPFATAQLALLLHCIKQSGNKLSGLMLLRNHLNNLLWMQQWLRTLPQLIWTRFLTSFLTWRLQGRAANTLQNHQLAAQILDPDRIPLEDAIFLELIRPNTPIPPLLTELTTITNDMVSTAERFLEVAINFLEFMRRPADKYLVRHDDIRIKHPILAPHNGKVFDIPILVQQLSVHRMADTFLQDKRIGLGLDTLQLTRKRIQLCLPSKKGRTNHLIGFWKTLSWKVL
jgi:hypothetical protein